MSENNDPRNSNEIGENDDLPVVEIVDPSDDENVNDPPNSNPNNVEPLKIENANIVTTNTNNTNANNVNDPGNILETGNNEGNEVATVVTKPDDNIKEIILNKKVSNENNENNNFGETLTVTDVEVVPKYESKLGHEMFLRIMENDMLRDVPVVLQSNKLVQEEIRKKAERFYNLKEQGDQILRKEKEDGYKHIKFVEYLKEEKFDKVKWLYPVVLDQHVIYALKCDKKKVDEFEENNNDKEEEEVYTGEVPYGDIMENQLDQMKEIHSLYKKLGKGDINLVSFYTNFGKQTEPYKVAPDSFWKDGNNPKSKELKLSEYSELYRYINLNNPRKLKNRVGKGPTVIPLSVPEKKEKVETFIDDIDLERKSLTVDSGETVNIVGFLFLPELVHYDDADRLYNKTSLIEEALQNKFIIKNDVKPNLDLDKPAFLVFENASNEDNHSVDPDNYIKMIRELVPSPDKVIDFILKTSDNLDIYGFNQKLKKWGYKLGTITPESWEKARDVINNNTTLKGSPTKTGIKFEDIGDVCKIGEDNLLRDSQYRSKLMRTIYTPDLIYTADISKYFRGDNSSQQRTNILFNTDDNGSFYYTHSFYHMRDEIAKNIKRLEKIKKVLEKEVANSNVKNEELPQENIADQLEDINIVKLNENFDKLDKLSSRNYKSLLQLKQNRKLIEQLDKSIKEYKERDKNFRKLLHNEAGFLVLHYMANVVKKIDKERLSNAFLGKLLHNKEQETNDKKPTFTLVEDTVPALQSVINQINQIGTYSDKKQMLYTIIQLDGIIINKYIYSIFYGKPLICGHWYYLMLIDHSDTELERQQWVTELLSIYGDDGEASRGEDNCVVCGSFLDRTSLVESMYIDQWGNPIKLREAYEEERRRYTYLHSLPLSVYDIISTGVKDCKSQEFMDFLKRRKLADPENIKKATLACKLVNGMCSKMDINIHPRHFIELIIVCVRESKKIAEFTSYLTEKIKEVRIKKKLSEDKALRLSESSKFVNKVLKSYYGYFMVRYGTLILAHLLWYLRTSIPQYIPGNNAITSCSFFGFNENNGFDYFTCIVVQAKMLTVRVKIDGVSVNENIPKHKIVKNLRYWVQNLEPHYNYALLKREAYEKDNELFNIRVGSNRSDRVDNPFDWSEGEIKEIENPSEIVEKLDKILKSNEPAAFNKEYNEILFEIRKRVFKIRNFLNKWINGDIPKTYGDALHTTDGQVTCCEEILEERPGEVSIYIDYFKDINEKIVELPDDLIELQLQYTLMNNFLMTTHYLISSFQLPIKSINQVPVNIIDTPDSFIKSAFETYCHDGVTRAELHSFDNENFPEIERCIKCGWFAKKLKESEFSREEYVNLMNDVDKKSLRDYETIKTDRKRLNFVSLKRSSSSEKIKTDSDKLAMRIARKFSDGKLSEKDIITKVTSFLKNIDNFKNFIPDPEGEDATEKKKVQAITRRNKFAIQKMKEYINEYFRKNISRIKWGYKIKSNIDTNWISKKDEEKWQKILVDKNAWLEPFLTKTNEKLFKKFRFNFTIDNINSILGGTARYDSTYKTFIMASRFDLNDALRLLKHYFIKEMLLFMDLAGPGEPILADFYMKLFDEIEKDRNVINLPKSEITKWTDTMQEDNNIVRLKYFDALREEGSLVTAPFKRFTEEIYSDPIFNPKLVTNVEVEQEQEEAENVENEEYLKEKAQIELGDEANAQSVEDYVQEAIENEIVNDEINEEVYDNHLKKEGEDIMDIGYDYGDQEQGTENAGDGFNDYSMNEIWEPVHEIDVQE